MEFTKTIKFNKGGRKKWVAVKQVITKVNVSTMEKTK